MKNNHGGKRPRSGRKKVADPAKQLSIYAKQSIIDAVGGREHAKIICLAALATEAEFGKRKLIKQHLEKPVEKRFGKTKTHS